MLTREGCMGSGRTNLKREFCLPFPCPSQMDPIPGFSSLKLGLGAGGAATFSSQLNGLAANQAVRVDGGWL